MLNKEQILQKKRLKIGVLSGAGISAESGIQTFRDAGGLWEGHDVMEVASPEGWEANMPLVLDFYNKRRKQLLEVSPNLAHLDLVDLEQIHDVTIITQNVDDLHERAGSTNVLHLHGELLKVRSTIDESLIYEWKTDLNLDHVCDKGGQLRPHIVWFGEAVPMINIAAEMIAGMDIVIIVGTSMQVYPAAGLIEFAHSNCKVYYVDPNASAQNLPSRLNITTIAEKATIGIRKVIASIS